MSISPLAQYRQDLTDPNFQADPYQVAAIEVLDKIYGQLCTEAQHQNSKLRFFYKRKMIKGCYLWGDVGTGKSYLMNTFFHCLPFKQKRRLHFHEFMHSIHAELKALQGKKNPLKLIAKRWAKQTLVLCFDEFFVKDIADAMLLGHLLQYLIAAGICLIATSNVPPVDLYRNGLQRKRFLPAIKILQQTLEVLRVDNNIDYRLCHIKPAKVYFSPLDEHSTQEMMHSYHYYAAGDVACHEPLQINQRLLQPIRRAAKVIWFDFATLCESARSSDDYLQIAQQFTVIMLSNVPLIASNKSDIIVRFINLIDVLYDHHSLLVMSIAVPIDQLYSGEKWGFEFKRTCSRLQEMQSEQYMKKTAWTDN